MAARLALEKTRGGKPFGAVRALLEQDFQRRFETGEGATVPALAAEDPKLAGYIAQSEELFPTFRNQITLASMEQVLLWAPLFEPSPTPEEARARACAPSTARDGSRRAEHNHPWAEPIVRGMDAAT